MSNDPLVRVLHDPSYEEVQLAKRVRQLIADELQDSTVAISVVPLVVDPFQRSPHVNLDPFQKGHHVSLGVTVNGRRWEFVTTQCTDDVESTRFLVAMFRRALERKIANG